MDRGRGRCPCGSHQPVFQQQRRAELGRDFTCCPWAHREAVSREVQGADLVISHGPWTKPCCDDAIPDHVLLCSPQNDLRPDISKDPWVSREEYILARAHCDVGNQWAEIAKYLPGRSENSLKNHCECLTGELGCWRPGMRVCLWCVRSLDELH